MSAYLVLISLLHGLLAGEIAPATLQTHPEVLNSGGKETAEGPGGQEKVDVLGEIFKSNIEKFKAADKLEVLFLIDGSSSVGELNFRSEIKFVKKLLSDVTVDYDHARVAVITFSSSVTTNVDQISEPRTENNKCFLLNKLTKIEYKGGGTYTADAFKLAQDVLAHSRNDSKKVLFLITDGFSNGGDPTSIAAELKSNDVTIFTIGIKNGNYRELYELASAPGELYSYLLDSFQEFESLARRALHVDLKSGDYVPLGINSPCEGLCGSGNCCDQNALCTCGTTTGHYACVCQPGYYGSGLENSCLLCPAGTYSNGPNLCLPCPDAHHTTTPPAFKIQDCKCKSGYQSTGDNKCKTLRCDKIQSPEHGYFVNKHDCGNVLHSACGIRCEVGYSLVGSSIRLCQENASWSGEAPSCQVKTCPKLTPPVFGSMTCSHSDLDVTYNATEEHLPVDTVCSFECQTGKTLIGSAQRTCLPLARWDGLKASCKQIKCPRLPALKHGAIEPRACTTGKQSFGKSCKLSCDPGFRLDGPSQIKCTARHGSWDSEFGSTTCVDIQPPAILCPQNVTVDATAGENFATVSWDKPLVDDNSELEVAVWMKPSIKNITGFKFQIGETMVTYFAQDAYQNRAKCRFFVRVEAPSVDECVDPPTYLTTDADGANVTWDEPAFFDNSHVVKFNKSHDFGFFPIGTTTVTYDVVDGAGNKNSCSINITVEALKPHCEAIIDPVYGHSDCSFKTQQIECVITCAEGYAVPLSQPESYDNNSISFMCNDAESLVFNQEDLTFPECSVTEISNEMEQNGTVTLTSDLETCHNTSQLNDIENDIKVLVEHELCSGNCSLHTETSCESLDTDDAEEQSNIIKRETQLNKRGQKRRLNVKFQVKSRFLNPTQGLSSSRNATIQYGKPRFLCPAGFIPRKQRCVQCPKGTFHNSTRNRCQSCALGSYTDQVGQAQCKECPIHHSTRKLHSKRLEECKEQCPPGTHARRKILRHSRRHNGTIERATLKPHCRLCRPGFYQANYGALKCLPCPEGYTTTSARATSVEKCIATGQRTCQKYPKICNTGQCVASNDYQYTCLCPDNYIGSHCEKKPSACDSNPCLNSGTCHANGTGYTCTCPSQFSGTICEKPREKCLLICLNNGSCHSTDVNDYFCVCPSGYGGETCQIKLNYCVSNFCENNASCHEDNHGFKCLCTRGYIGKRCSLLPCDYRPCPGNSICSNLDVENATRASYKCTCPANFSGRLCDEKTDNCHSSPCQNGGSCESLQASYRCSCARFYYGVNCELKRRSDYVLHFQRFSTADYVKLRGFEANISEISACLWMQSKDDFNYGTLLSYATQAYDNAFTITDYTGLVLYINNQYVVSDILVNDGLWHHLCVTWNSSGTYKLYVDGTVVKSGASLAADTKIEAAGNMIIGQEQDIIGGRFSQTETFIGRLAHVDVWSKELSKQEILTHMNDCQDAIFGDVYGWPDVQSFVEGNILIENSSFCNKCQEPHPLYNGIIDIVDNVAYYDCYKGYYLSSASFKEGRKCTKASKWEGQHEPYCKKVYCGHPGYIRNGYMFGRNFFYNEKVTYQCYKNHNLTGNSTILCKETGEWMPEKPKCVGVQCVLLKIDNGNITVLTEHNYEESPPVDYFDSGVQIEVVCEPKANLSGQNILTCTDDGTWDYEVPKCVLPAPPGCDVKKLPKPPANGVTVLDSLYAAGNGSSEIVEYKCNTGYNLIGDNSTTCIIDGYWTEPNITCIPVDCPSPRYKNTVIAAGAQQNYVFSNTLKFDCIEGYKMFGDSTIRCLATGKWSRMRGRCSKKSCRRPIVQAETIVQGFSYLFDDQVTLVCPNGQKYGLKCSKSGVWTGERDDSC